MNNKFLEALLILIGIFAVLYLFFEIRDIVVYIGISAVISAIGMPIVKVLGKVKIGKFKLGNSLSVFITIFGFLMILVAIGLSLIPLIKEQAHNISLVHIDKIEENFHQSIDHLNTYLGHLGFDAIDLHKDLKLKSVVNFDFIPNILNSIIGAMGNLTVAILTILFISFFLMKDHDLIKAELMEILEKEKGEKFEKMVKNIKNSLSKYILGLFIQIIVLFVLYMILLYFVGVSNFIVIALLGALLNLIPYVGPLIGLLLMNLLAITSHMNEDFHLVIYPMVTKITVGYIFVQLIDNFVNQPLIFSKSANAHPLEIFLVILIAGNLFGVIGMIVAVPMYTVIRILLKEFFSRSKIVQALTKNL